MRASDFRRIALGMLGAVESAHMGHPDFRANDRIFATLHHEGQSGMVTLTPDEQERFVRDHPGGFAPEAGAWGRAGCTRVTLAVAQEDTLGEALTLAWQHTVTKGASRLPAPGPSRGAARRSRRR